MKIGKEVKRVKSPARRTQKATKRPGFIPVQIPEKEPAKVGQGSAELNTWRYVGRLGWGMSVVRPEAYLITSAT